MVAIPSKGWASYEAAVKAIGERRGTSVVADLPFLREIGLVEAEEPVRLTEAGREYFDARYIRLDEESATKVLTHVLLLVPPVIAVAQLLDGVAGASRNSIETVLRSQGFGEGLKDRNIGFFVSLLDRANILRYSKNTGAVEVLAHVAASEEPPPSVFISPTTPYGNRVWLRRVLAEGEGSLSWLDKHFTTAALEVLWEAVDGHRVSQVRILSLYLEDYHSGRKVKRDFGNLVAEFGNRGVDLEWRVIDSKLIRDTHDRWVISETSARNIPNVNAIFSGQHSELNRSDQRVELAKVFDEYWSQAVDIATVWGGQSS